MLPGGSLEIAEECARMYEVACDAVQKNGPTVSPAWLFGLAREIVERGSDLTRYELPAEALTWNFRALLYLVRWTWRTLEPPPDESPPPDLAPWNKPASAMSQLDLRDSLRALATRWTTLRPSPVLWRWLEQLDRRAADLCVRSDVGEALDEDFREVDGCKVATEGFITDTVGIMADMMRARFVHRDFLSAVSKIYAPPEMPTVGALAWLERERDRITIEAREVLDGELARLSVRPGEVDSYARSRQGIIPDDLRAVMRQCRPLLSDYRKETPMEPYLIFGRVCQRHSFEWLQLALITDDDYFRMTESGATCRDVMMNLKEPTILRIMGSDYVYRNAEPGEHCAWRCASPVEAICLWISLVSPCYRMDSVQWDMKFLKDAFDIWRHGETVRRNEVLIV